MSTYTYHHPATGFPVYTRTMLDAEHSRTYWHPSGRVTHERREQVSETVDGEPTYLWVRDDQH